MSIYQNHIPNTYFSGTTLGLVTALVKTLFLTNFVGSSGNLLRTVLRTRGDIGDFLITFFSNFDGGVIDNFLTGRFTAKAVNNKLKIINT